MITQPGQPEFDSPATELGWSRGIRAGLVVYLIACAARAILLTRIGHDLTACCLAPDSAEYLRLSEGALFNLSRTPGYPAFLWLSRELFGPSLTAVLWVQVFLTSLTPALTALLAAVAFPRYPAAAYVAGILSAISFTGLTLSHFILSEAVFVPLVTAALVITWLSAKTARASLMFLAALLGGLAFLVKPVFVIWSVVLPVLWLVFAERQKTPPVRTIAVATILTLVFPIGWSLVNRARSGVFAPSSISAAAGCINLASRTLAFASRPSGPTLQEVRNARADLTAGVTGLQTEAAVYRYYSECARRVVLEHPLSAWRAYRANAIEALPRPFDAREFRYAPGIPRLEAGIVRFTFARLTDLVYLLAFLGALRLIADGRARLVAGLGFLFAALWAPSALVYGQGARYLYPVEFTLSLLAGVAVVRRSAGDPVHALTVRNEYVPRRGIHVLSVIVPVHADAAALDLVQKVSTARLPDSTELEIILVDDACGDDLAARLDLLARRDPRIGIVRHSAARGRATAFRTGIAQSTGDLVVLQRPDPAYEPDDYANLVAPIVNGQADAVYGSRWAANTRRVQPFWHGLVQRGLTLAVNTIHNCDLSDLQTGQKAFRGDLIRGIALEVERDQVDVELTAKLLRSGARLFEVPIRYAHHVQGRLESSLSDVVGALLAIVWYRLVREPDPKEVDRLAIASVRTNTNAHPSD